MFQRALQIILFHEGGYVKDLHDPGGETNMGICKREFPDLDIKNLTITEVSDIYFKKYWTPCRCDRLPDPLALIVFDCAVNQGVQTAIKMLQMVIGVRGDGVIGTRTLSAVAKWDVKALVNAFTAARILRYTETRNWDTYKKGWIRRVVDVHQKCFE